MLVLLVLGTVFDVGSIGWSRIPVLRGGRCGSIRDSRLWVGIRVVIRVVVCTVLLGNVLGQNF